MEKNVFDIGKEDFSVWIKEHEKVLHIVLMGRTTHERFCQLSYLFDYTRFSFVTIDNLKIGNKVSENAYTRSFEETVSYHVAEDGIKVDPLDKMILNAKGSATYRIVNGDIYTNDLKTLIHKGKLPSKLVIPSAIERIGNYVFSGCEKISQIILNDGLTSIGKYAFAWVQDLKEIMIPNSVVSLGVGAFYCCNIEKLQLSNQLQEIPDACFLFNQLEELNVPFSIRRIGNGVFRGAWFEKVVIPEGVESIGFDAFENLTEIELPSTLTEIASDFYYEEVVDDSTHPPFVKISKNNPKFYAKDGTLYFRANNQVALDCKYNGIPNDYNI